MSSCPSFVSYGNMLLSYPLALREKRIWLAHDDSGCFVPMNFDGDILFGTNEDQTTDDLVLHSRSAAFEDLCRLYHLEVKRMPQKRFWSVLEACGERTNRDSRYPWEAILGKRVYREQVELWAKDIQQQWRDNVSNDSVFGYWLGTYAKTLPDEKWNLKPFHVDVELYEALRKENPTDSVLSSFEPEDYDTGECEVSTYSKSGSVTGRLVCLSGANPLRLKRVFRDKMLVSKWQKEGGKVVSLDYAALEPRVILWLNAIRQGVKDRSPTTDLYQGIADTWLAGHGISREVIKTVILSLLYGASIGTIKLKLGNDMQHEQVRDLVLLIQEKFCLQELKRQLIYEATNNDNGKTMIFNAFGRPIFLDDVEEDGGNISSFLVNYWTQSTAVDVALLGFQKIFDRINSSEAVSEWIRPLGVLHDALLLDIHPMALHLIPKLVKLASEPVPGSTFPVKVSTLS